MQAVKQGERVAAVERLEQVGGSCTHEGTIPSSSVSTDADACEFDD